MSAEPTLSMAVSEPGRRRSFGLFTGALALLALLLAVVSPASAATPGFSDVPSTHAFFSAITDLASRGVVSGFPDGRFGPGDPVTRQQFAKMIVLAAAYPVSEADICPFVDVARGGDATLYPDNYVAVCAARGITVGKTASIFGPYSNITRYQVVSMLTRAADSLYPGLLATPPAGWAGNSRWAADLTHGPDAALAEYNGLLKGLDLSALDPTAPMNRGEVAQVLSNTLTRFAQPPQPRTVTLTISLAPGSGKVTLSPDRTTFSPGETVTLTANPAAGYTFVGWRGGADGLANPLSVVMNTDISITALFRPVAPLFDSLGGVITSAPAACARASGLLDVFARGATGTLVHRRWDGEAWSDWEDLGGSIEPGSDPAVVSWGPDRLDVFVRGTDDALWHKWWDGNSWSDWESLGGALASGPAVAYRDAGGDQKWLDVFMVGSDQQLQRRTFDGVSWSAWAPAGENGPTPKAGSSPTAVTWGAVRIDLFIQATDGALWHTFLSSDGEWSPWENTGPAFASRPAASTWGSWAEDRLDLFAQGADFGLWHESMVSAIWSGWEHLDLGVIGSAPAAVSASADRIDVFVRGTDDTLWHEVLNGWGWVP